MKSDYKLHLPIIELQIDYLSHWISVDGRISRFPTLSFLFLWLGLVLLVNMGLSLSGRNEILLCWNPFHWFLYDDTVKFFYVVYIMASLVLIVTEESSFFSCLLIYCLAANANWFLKRLPLVLVLQYWYVYVRFGASLNLAMYSFH